MAIKAADIKIQAQGLLDDSEDGSYYSDAFYIRAINSGIYHAFKACYNLNEFLYLLNTSLTITSQNVTDEERSYALPAKTIYVSNFCDRDAGDEIDFRPKLTVSGNTEGSRLTEQMHYTIDGSNFILNTVPTSAGSIEINYKALPSKITNLDTAIPILQDLFEDFLIEYVVWYALRKMEDGNFMNNRYLADQINEVRYLLSRMSGTPRNFIPTWPGDNDT